MRRSLVLTAVVLSIATIAAIPRGSPSPGDEIAVRVDSLISRLAAADSFSGTIAIARNGQLVYQRAVGVANRESGTSMSIDTKLQIASATKLYTSIAIRQLEQAGQLSLSDTVGKFLPRYPNATVRRKVTIEQLLKHRSGIGSFWNERFVARRADLRTVQDYLELFQNDSLLFAPGTSEAYSNGGYVVLGAIIEKLSGKSYHDYLRDRVFRPAGMTQSVPYDRRATVANAAIGYTTQPLAGPIGGDQRLAGSGPRPGQQGGTSVSPQMVRRSPDSSGASNAAGPRLRIMGPDGRELSADEARAAMARRAAEGGGVRRSNTSIQPGISSPAGDHYSTVGDFLKLAAAITSYRLLDSAHTAALLGQRYAAGTDFRANGGGPGVNAEFSIYPSGDVMAVISNYDPPSATNVAQHIRSLLQPTSAPAAQPGLKEEIDALHEAMIAAFKRSPASVAQFYTDDAKVIGMGMHVTGKAEVEGYWSQSMGPTDWKLEAIEIGGTREQPWLLGRSTISGSGGRKMVTDYVGILQRGSDGKLRYRIDLFTPADRPMMRAP